MLGFHVAARPFCMEGRSGEGECDGAEQSHGETSNHGSSPQDGISV
jgi:hypothetical protein